MVSVFDFINALFDFINITTFIKDLGVGGAV